MLDEYISVSELNLYIKTYLENNYFLQDVYVKGEISNFKRHQSGTLYFAIKDEKCAVNVVMFQSYANKLKVALKDGDLVLIKGKISVYEARGTYSINAVEIIFDSKGMLLIQYEQLKEKLFNEGLFDIKYKKPLPKYPNKIGIITAPYGAAIQDMLRTIKQRWPIASVYIYPSLVQGNDAKFDIVKNIKLADNDNLDVIICGRGGGSIEDLWPFNEEIVARAIYKSRIPIISGVGHEIDFTISDFVADLRAPTPTGAATFAVPDMDEVKRYFKSAREKCNLAILNTLNKNRELINKYKSNYILNNPVKLYEMQEQRLDILYDRLNTSLKSIMDTYYHILDKYKSNYILNNPSILYETKMEKLNVIKDNLNKAIVKNYDNSFNRFETVKLKLDLLNPKTILGKGYSIVYKDNKVVKDIKNIKESDSINIVLGSGNVDAVVKGVNE